MQKTEGKESFLESDDVEHTFETFKKDIEENNSFGTVRGYETMFKLFDNFCISKYQKGMHQVILEIQGNPEKRVWGVLRNWITYEKEQKIGRASCRERV